MNKKSGLKPGQKAPASGQYEIIGRRGGRTGKERTVVWGEPLPPTLKPDQRCHLVDRTQKRQVEASNQGQLITQQNGFLC